MVSSPRICPACQTSNPPQAAFCFGCGKPLGQTSVTPELLHQRYHLLHQLGSGGFGAVYQAEDTQLGGRLVAVKEMSSQSGMSAQENAEAMEAFKKEALLLAELMHPNLPRIYDHFSEGGRWYLAMDYIEGETLEEYLSKQADGSLPLSEALEIGLQLCDVLDYLHTRQPPIIFRDLKPLNIMRTASGHLYLIDFGIARHFKPGQVKDTIAFGSPGYAAPEQYGKTQTTPRSDIYSLGATLHQMLSGIDPSLNPFRFSPLRLPNNRPTPRALAALLTRMLDMDELRRPVSMSAVKVELQDIATRVASGTFSIIKLSTSAPVSGVSSPPQPVVQPAPVPPPPPVTIGTLRCRHEARHDSVRALAWSPDSRLLLSAGNGNLIEVWDAASGQTIHSYSNHGGSIRMAFWSPDGKYIASASEDKTVQVWEAGTGRTVQVYRGHTHLVTGLGWSPDSSRIASSSFDRTVHVWEVQAGSTSIIYTKHNDMISCASWSPNGKYVASGGYDSTVRVWEALNGRHILTYKGHAGLILTLSWSPDSTRVVSSSYDRTVRIWDAFDGHAIAMQGSHNGLARSMSWSPDGTRIVSCGGWGEAWIWNANTVDEIFTYLGHQLSPKLQPLGFGETPSGNRRVAIINGQLYQYTSSSSTGVTAVAWSPDGRWIASGGTEHVLRVWQAE